jgi:Cu+-exporting ATPase
MQRMADQVAGYFVMAVVSIALLTFLDGLVWSRTQLGLRSDQCGGRFNHRLSLRIRPRNPMSIMVATGRGATHGVLFRDAAAIENLRKIDTLIIDKTGTLTEDSPPSTFLYRCRDMRLTKYCAWPPAWIRVASIRWRTP